jgi:hypothetical protein
VGFDASEIDASASVDDVQSSGDRWQHTIPSGRGWRRPRLERMKPRIWQTFWRAARTCPRRRCAEETKPTPRARTEGKNGVVLADRAQLFDDRNAALATRGLSTKVFRKQPDGTWLFVIDSPYIPEPSHR